jgi:hypothetical protein
MFQISYGICTMGRFTSKMVKSDMVSCKEGIISDRYGPKFKSFESFYCIIKMQKYAHKSKNA